MPVDITPGKERLTVVLKMDFKDYCEAYQALLKNCEALRLIEKRNPAVPGTVTESEIIAKVEHKVALSSFRALRVFWVGQLIGLIGEMQWERVKKELAKQCDPSNPQEAELNAFLITGGGKVPLVLESLSANFKELLTNSIDARLLQYLKAGGKTSLEMIVTLKLEAGKLIIVIKDNAGGFSDKFLEAFPRDSRTRDYSRWSFSEAKREFEDYCFGGRGLGMQRLADFLLFGGVKERASSDVLRVQYDIPAGSTDFLVRNCAGGAEITLSSPLKPFPPALHLAAAASVSSFLSLKKPGIAPEETAAVTNGSPGMASVRSDSTVSPGMTSMRPHLVVEALQLPVGALSMPPIPPHLHGFFTKPLVECEGDDPSIPRLIPPMGEGSAAAAGEKGLAEEAAAVRRKLGAT